MHFIRAISFYIIVRLAWTQCPALSPPVNGVVKCQQYQTEPAIRCTATCDEGHVFQNNQRVVTRSCRTGANLWSEGQSDLPICIPKCDRALLAGSNKRTTASSWLTSSTDAGAALLVSQQGVWRPALDDVMQFIQVDLGSLHRVAGWTLRGDSQGNYVSLFRLLFSHNAVTWTPYSDAVVTEKFFSGNVDSVTKVTELLSTAQIARYVRLNPLDWHGHVAVQWDLVGCPLYDDSASAIPPGTGDKSCKMTVIPAGGAVNCESNGTIVVCTAYCLDGLVFGSVGPAVDMTCDAHSGLFTHTPLPPCVQGDTMSTATTNITGTCLQGEHDCIHTSNGDYQYCGNCHYFSTCSEGYFFVRPCPAHLQYDSQRAQCNYESTTCRTKHNGTRLAA